MFGGKAGTLWVAPGLRKDKKLQRVIRGGKDGQWDDGLF